MNAPHIKRCHPAAGTAADAAECRSTNASLSAILRDLDVSVLDNATAARLDAAVQAGSPVRLGILGGTFDPIHLGHLRCAEQAREAASLDLVLLMPAGSPAFKPGQKLASSKARLRMCQLAAADNPHFAVSSMELRRPGKTYTSDTLRIMRAALPESVWLRFIVGTDALKTLDRWHESCAIAQLAGIIGVLRPDCPVKPECKQKLSDLGFQVEYVNTEALAISSTRIREKVMKGESVRYLLAPSVYDYLCENGLYARTDTCAHKMNAEGGELHVEGC